MNIENIYKQLLSVLPKDKIKLNENMSKHTTFKIGGPADIFIIIDTIEEIKNILKIINENNLPYRIIGNGSNILFKDEGYRGIILKDNLNNYNIEKKQNKALLTVNSGVKLSMLGQKCLKEAIEGFEFASGIPRNNRRSSKNECWSSWKRNERHNRNSNIYK